MSVSFPVSLFDCCIVPLSVSTKIMKQTIVKTKSKSRVQSGPPFYLTLHCIAVLDVVLKYFLNEVAKNVSHGELLFSVANSSIYIFSVISTFLLGHSQVKLCVNCRVTVKIECRRRSSANIMVTLHTFLSELVNLSSKLKL